MILLPHLLKAPSFTGAVLPSSQFLARAMADAARGAGRIVELGAGTGPVTRALARAFPGTALTVVELQPSLARRLVKAFPSAQVLAQPAAAVLDELVGPPAGGPLVLVSSLPFRSLPPPVHAQTREAILRCLARHPGSWLVQFTYQPRAPFDPTPGWRWTRGRMVVANIPPAAVWTLRAQPGLNGAGDAPAISVAP